MILNTIVLWAHIFGAIGWMGAAMVFAFVIGPSLAKMSPQARLEFFAKAAPRYLRYVELFTLLTIIFGVAMVAVLADGDTSILSLDTTFGVAIAVGATLAVVAVGLAMGVIVPTARKISEISKQLLEKPGPPPPELPALSNRLKVSSAVGLVLLILVTIMMVAAATY